jgi:hypothetical protein
MTKRFRLLFLVAGLALAGIVSASASGTVLACYVTCSYPDGSSTNHYVSGPMSYSDCCGGPSPWVFSCPNGGQAFAYGYEDWSGPQFCM